MAARCPSAVAVDGESSPKVDKSESGINNPELGTVSPLVSLVAPVPNTSEVASRVPLWYS
ncbi:MAG: hypothetical protein QNJ47_03445 [Nostocaceae cyanobacterium]|nr:hypothetical protein [Nostocaceae cyanobacterium]